MEGGNLTHQGELGREEIIKSKYLLGTDGAHSWTRRQVGLKMNGERTKKHFGVIDIIPISDFRKWYSSFYWVA